MDSCEAILANVPYAPTVLQLVMIQEEFEVMLATPKKESAPRPLLEPWPVSELSSDRILEVFHVMFGAVVFRKKRSLDYTEEQGRVDPIMEVQVSRKITRK